MGEISIEFLRRAEDTGYYGKLPREDFDGSRWPYLRPAIEVTSAVEGDFVHGVHHPVVGGVRIVTAVDGSRVKGPCQEEEPVEMDDSGRRQRWANRRALPWEPGTPAGHRIPYRSTR